MERHYGDDCQLHFENQGIYQNARHSSKNRPQKVNKSKTMSVSRHHDISVDQDIPREMEEFFAWKQKNYEKEIQKLKSLPGKTRSRRAGQSLYYSSDDDINQNHLPGGGPPLSGSAMRNNLLGAIQLKRRASNQSEEKFDPTKSIPNLSYQGPKEEPEPSTSQPAPPPEPAPPREPAPPPDQDTGGDPMKNLLGAIHEKKPETDFIEETFDPTKSIPNLSYQSPVEEPIEERGTDIEEVEEASVAPSYDESFVSSRSARVMNNQSSKEYAPPKKSNTRSKLARNSQTQTQDPPSLTSVLSAAQPERKPSIRRSSNAGVDNSVSLVRPSLVRFSQHTQEYPIEALRDSRSRESTRGVGGYEEEEAIISSHRVQTREDLDARGQDRRDACPLIKVNEDNTMSPVKFKHELNDIIRATSDDHLPELSRELQSLMNKFHDVPLNKVMHFAETGSYIRESFMNSNICDISVHVGKDIYPAHRIVLACFSPYLASFLENDEDSSKHKKPKDIRISGVSERSVKLLLNYVYTGELRMETVLIPDIIKLAEKFEVSVVRQKCFDHIEVMTDDELVALLSVMKDTHDVEYCDFIMRSISSKFMRVKDCETFLQVDIDTLCMILTHGALILRSEMDIFYSCLNWLQNVDAKERCNYLDRVMECVRFPLMNHAELYECVERCSLFKSNKTCMQRILEANWLLTMSMLNKQDPFRMYVPSHRNDVNSSASVSDYMARTCGRVRSDVTVEVARENCSPRYDSDPGMSRMRTSPLHEGPRNNNAESASDVSIYKDQIYPANQMVSGMDSSNQMLEQEKIWYGQNVSSTRDSGLEDFSGQLSSSDSQSTFADSRRSSRGSTPSKKRSRYKDSAADVSKVNPSRVHTVVFLKNRMYIIGGCDTKDGVSTPSRDVLVYDKRNRTWRAVAPLRSARMYHCVCVVNEQIYAIGGIGEDNSILKTVECYDPSSNCWSFVKTLKEARMGACASEYGGQLFVAGGYGNSVDGSGEFPILHSMECFNPYTNKWTLKRNMRYGRAYANLVSVGHSLYLSGGFALGGPSRDQCLASVDDVDEYDVYSDTWVWKTCLGTGRHCAGCFESDGRVYIFGGISSQLGHALNDVECFDPQKNSVFKPARYPYQVHWIKRVAL